MPAQPSDVSVVIPSHNRWRLLVVAIASALAQGGNVEVVVVDDGSADGTADAIAGLQDGRIRLIRNESASGPAAARNVGVAAAAGGWVALLDDDDVWSPVKVGSQLEALHGAKASFAYGEALLVDARLESMRRVACPSPGALAGELMRHQAIPAGASNVMVSKALLEAVGGFEPNLVPIEDWDMWLRLVDSGTGGRNP